MKKLLTASILSCTAITANAEYTIMIPLEQAQGGHLPNGSIQLGKTAPAPVENWVAIDPVYSEWYDIGEPYDCNPDGWKPAPSTIDEGEEFTQTNQWCYIREERAIQSREQETTTGLVRNVGAAVIESGYRDASDTRTAIGTKPIKKCQYNQGDSDSYWAAQESGYRIKNLYWDGVDLAYWDSSLEDWLIPEEIGGDIYSPGEYVKSETKENWRGDIFNIDYYSICRDKL